MAAAPWSILSWRKDRRVIWVGFNMLCWFVCGVDNCLQVAKLLEIVRRGNAALRSYSKPAPFESNESEVKIYMASGFQNVQLHEVLPVRIPCNLGPLREFWVQENQNIERILIVALYS